MFSFFRSSSPVNVNIPTGDVLTTTISTTKWLYTKIVGTATAELSPENNTVHQSAEAYSKEELDAQKRLEAEQQAARARIKKREEEKKKIKNILIKKELAPLNLPPQAMLFSEFEKESRHSLDLQCFHQIFMVTKDGKRYFYKQNEPDSPMSELEAYCWAVTDFIAHHHVPSATIPVYNDQGQFIGVCCEEIPKFNPIGKTTFDVSDFRIAVSNKKIMTPPMLAKLDEWARSRRVDLQQIIKRQSLDTENWTYLEESDETHKQETKLIEKVIKQEKWFESKDLYSEKPSEILELVQAYAADLIKFRKVKGYSISFTSRILVGNDDDFHNRNGGEGEKQDGVIDIFNIDLDMNRWPVLSKHKKIGIVDNYTRDPSSSGIIFRNPIGRFTKTRNDIAMFPRTKDLNTFYKPCSGIPTVPDRLHSLISKSMSMVGIKNFDFTNYVSKNAYTKDSQAAFSELTTNDVAIYYKFKTLLQYILTDPSHYEKAGEMFIRKDVIHEGKQTIREAMNTYESEELNGVKHELFNMGYNLELTYKQEPKDHELQSDRLYVFLDYYQSITLKAKNAVGSIESITLSKEELGEAYSSLFATLSCPDASIKERDLDILADLAAKKGYALTNTKYEFKQFLRDYGNAVKQEIFAEFEDINKTYKTQIFDLNQMKSTYANYMAQAGAVFSDEQVVSNLSANIQNTDRIIQTP